LIYGGTLGHLHVVLGSPLLVSCNSYDDEQKMEIIARHFKAIMETLGLDLTDDSSKGAPARVAKMYVKEIFSGLDQANKPTISLFNNSYQYNEMLIEKNITLYTYCEHHFVPIIGKAHVAYIPEGKVIGLSKIIDIRSSLSSDNVHQNVA
jgi:GTP cyclohydrolase I